MIDSKPVQPPYLSLVPFKSFNKGDNQTVVIGRSSKDMEADLRSTNKNSHVKWSKLLHEDLEELLRLKAEVPLEKRKGPSNGENPQKKKVSGSGEGPSPGKTTEGSAPPKP